MNYGELKQAILDDTHRSDLSTHVARFVRQCEGLIRRDLKAYLLRTTITVSSLVSGGVYNLPARSLVVRSIKLQGRQGDDLVRVSPGQIRRLDSTADVVQYCQNGDRTIEFRGVPSATDVFDLTYFGTPAPFASDSDENTLLTDHETLYMAGSKFFLYLHTQDKELAKDELDIFNGVIDTLNEQMARRIGGAAIAPAYNFAGGSSY
jgi:hypothetical protein